MIASGCAPTLRVLAGSNGDPVPYGTTWSYDVFFGGDDVWGVNEADLELAPSPRLQVLPRDAFLRALLLAKPSNPLTDLLYAYQASRTQTEGLPRK